MVAGGGCYKPVTPNGVLGAAPIGGHHASRGLVLGPKSEPQPHLTLGARSEVPLFGAVEETEYADDTGYNASNQQPDRLVGRRTREEPGYLGAKGLRGINTQHYQHGPGDQQR